MQKSTSRLKPPVPVYFCSWFSVEFSYGGVTNGGLCVPLIQHISELPQHIKTTFFSIEMLHSNVVLKTICKSLYRYLGSLSLSLTVIQTHTPVFSQHKHSKRGETSDAGEVGDTVVIQVQEDQASQ